MTVSFPVPNGYRSHHFITFGRFPLAVNAIFNVDILVFVHCEKNTSGITGVVLFGGSTVPIAYSFAFVGGSGNKTREIIVLEHAGTARNGVLEELSRVSKRTKFNLDTFKSLFVESNRIK